MLETRLQAMTHVGTRRTAHLRSAELDAHDRKRLAKYHHSKLLRITAYDGYGFQPLEMWPDIFRNATDGGYVRVDLTQRA